jgi:hypothetical protein
LVLAVGWNYWLPTAEDFLNLQTKKTLPPNVDFLVSYIAGGRYESGANPYHWVSAEPEARDFTDYIYPPTMLPFYRWLASLEYNQARYLWAGLYAFSYLAAFGALLFAAARETRFTLLALGSLLTVASYPLILHIRNGQSDVLVISIVLLSFVAYSRDLRVVSAILLAFAALVKVSPILLLIYFVVFLRDYRFLTAFLIASGVMVLISLVAVPLELYPDYYLNVLPYVSGGTSYWLNQSILKFVASNVLLAKVVSGTGILLFAVFTWFVGRRFTPLERTPRVPLGRDGFVAEGLFLMNLLVILLFAGKAWSMAYVWTILPSALLLAFLLHSTPKTWYLVVVAAAVFLLSSKVYGFPILDSLNLFGNLLLTACLAAWLLNREWVMERAAAAH